LRLNTPAYFAPSEENDFIDYLENEVEDYFVLEENGKIVGCGGINYWEHGTVARISWDIVHPDQQGKGIGKKLTLFRIEEIKKSHLYV
jgi:N-acetylglutamate synthase-like GNAT family acetyltransferase